MLIYNLQFVTELLNIWITWIYLDKNIRYHTDVDLQLAIRYLIAEYMSNMNLFR